jgi:hypothetical protein
VDAYFEMGGANEKKLSAQMQTMPQHSTALI